MSQPRQIVSHPKRSIDVALAHGASGSAASMQPYVDGLRVRGIWARAIGLPIGRAERAVAAYRRQLAASLAAEVIGGHSYGGRVASLLAADEPPRALVLLSYPLHRPGADEWRPRVSHWPRISCPVLLLSGEADPFAQLELLRAAVNELPNHELVTYPRIGHGLAPVLEDALDRVARFAAGL
jgi:predicted alpha/beta-hydrolase family hydrolase